MELEIKTNYIQGTVMCSLTVRLSWNTFRQISDAGKTPSGNAIDLSELALICKLDYRSSIS